MTFIYLGRKAVRRERRISALLRCAGYMSYQPSGESRETRT
jgi:hypothetical protein